MAAKRHIAMRNAFLDAIGGILAAAAGRLVMSAVKVAVQGAGQVARSGRPCRRHTLSPLGPPLPGGDGCLATSSIRQGAGGSAPSSHQG